MSITPTLSVVIPAYNAAATLCQTLDSVRGQTLPPLEVIVVDDGSVDDTSAMVSAYLARHALDGWTVIRQPNGGPARARDTGIRAARGSHIALLDADDTWFPDKLAVSARLLTDHRLDLLGARLGTTAAEDTFSPIDRRSMLFRNPYFTSTTVFSRAAYADVGGFDLGQRYSEDYKLWLAFAWHGKRCGRMSRPLASYRPDSAGPHQGLSSHLWKMQQGELENYRWLRRSGLAPWGWCLAGQAISWLKYLRRRAQRT